jgi:hypothetical protein
MAIEKVIDIKIESNADQAVGSLRSQLREAQADVAELSAKFGATSDEAIKAARRAAELRDAIGDARALTDAFNPDAKFKALSSSLAGVAGGFAAVQGGMALFGKQSEEVEQTLLKVQSAMALSQGLQQLGESVDAFKQLGAVARSYTIVQKIVTAGQWLWNAAMNANPIGALVIVITALIAAGVALVNYFKGASAATAQNTAAVKENEKAIKNQSETLQKNSTELDRKQKHELAMAKASGASASAIRALELKLIDEKIAYEKSAKAVAMNTYEKNKNYLMSLKAADADEDLIKRQTEVVNESVKQVNKQSENLKKAYDERKDIQLRHQVEIRQAQTDHQKEVQAKTKEHNQKLKDDAKEANEKKAKEEAEALKKIAEDKLAADMDSAKKAIEILDSLKPKETPAEKENREYQEKLAILEANNLSTEELTKKHLDNIQQIENDIKLKNDEKAAAELEKKINDQTTSYDEKIAAIDAEQALFQSQLDNKLITEEQYNDKTKKLSETRVQVDKKEREAKAANMQAVANLLGNVASLLGESTAAGKAAAVAQATISTYQAAVSSYNSLSGIPIVGPALGAVAAGVAVASGIANVNKILSVQVPGGGGGGGTAPTPAATPQPPSFNVVGSSSTNQLAQTIGQQSQTPVRSYVVASDVSTAQALDRNIIRNATIGG